VLTPQPLFWSKLPPHSISNTIWSNPDPGPGGLDLDLQDLPVILSATAVPEVAAKPKPKSGGVTSVLDLSTSPPFHIGSKGKLLMMTLDRSNNIGILLARLRLSPSKIRNAIWEVDDSVLDVDQLSMVSRMIPTHAEVSPCHLSFKVQASLTSVG
jgi:hypothetical protein